MGDPDSDLDTLKRIAQRMDDVFTIDLPDAPGFTFVAAKFKVENAVEKDRTWRFSAGAADPDPGRAFRRCMGEAAETLSQFLGPRSSRELSVLAQAEGLDAGETAALEAFAGPGGSTAGWLPAVRLVNGDRSSVPATLCLRDVGDRDRAGLSLGCAAGATPQSAIRSALLELVERDAVAMWWRGGLPAGAIAGDVLEQAGIRELLAGMRGSRAARNTWFLDLTTDIGVPVAAALSSHRDGSNMAFGFAAGETLAGCIRPALYELAQMELANAVTLTKLRHGGIASLAGPELRQLDRLSVLSAGMAPFLGGKAPKAHAALAQSDDVQLARDMVDRLAAMHIIPHMVDLTRAELGVPVVKLVASQLQPEPGELETSRLSLCRNLHAFGSNGVPQPDIL